MVEMNVDLVSMNQVEIVMLVQGVLLMHIMNKNEAVNGHVIQDILKEMAYVNMAINHVGLGNMQMEILVSIVQQNHPVLPTPTMALVIGVVTVGIIEKEIHA